MIDKQLMRRVIEKSREQNNFKKIEKSMVENQTEAWKDAKKMFAGIGVGIGGAVAMTGGLVGGIIAVENGDPSVIYPIMASLGMSIGLGSMVVGGKFEVKSNDATKNATSNRNELHKIIKGNYLESVYERDCKAIGLTEKETEYRIANGYANLPEREWKYDEDIQEFEKEQKRAFNYTHFLTNKELKDAGFNIREDKRDDSGIIKMFNLDEDQLNVEEITLENSQFDNNDEAEMGE